MGVVERPVQDGEDKAHGDDSERRHRPDDGGPPRPPRLAGRRPAQAMRSSPAAVLSRPSRAPVR